MSSGSVGLSVIAVHALVRDLRKVRHDCRYTEATFQRQASAHLREAYVKHPRMMTWLGISQSKGPIMPPSMRESLQVVHKAFGVVGSPLFFFPAIVLSSWYFGPVTIANCLVSGSTAIIARISPEVCSGLNLVFQADIERHWASQWAGMYGEADKVRDELRGLFQRDRQGCLPAWEIRVADIKRLKQQLKVSSPPTDDNTFAEASAYLDATFEKNDVAKDNQEFDMNDTAP